MSKTFDVTELSEQDVDTIALALDLYISSQPGEMSFANVDLLLRFDNLTNPVVNDSIVDQQDNVIRVDFNH